MMPSAAEGDEGPGEFERPDPASIPADRLRRLVSAAIQAVVAAAAIAGWNHLGEPDRLPFAVAVAAAVLWLAGRVAMALWYPVAAWRAAGYRLDERLLVFRRGVFWKSSTAVPLSRVQHTDVTQGPFERRFGIGRLVVHTAGDASSEVTVWGLSTDTAYRIRERLMARITSGDGV